MSTLILLALAFLFGYLAYDAHKLSVPAKDVPYSIAVAGLGLDVSGVPLHELDKLKSWSARYGLGDLSQSVWLWGVLSVACIIGAIVAFAT